MEGPFIKVMNTLGCVFVVSRSVVRYFYVAFLSVLSIVCGINVLHFSFVLIFTNAVR